MWEIYAEISCLILQRSYSAAMAASDQPKPPTHRIDIGMLRDNLASSYDERVQRHQDTIDCVDALRGLAHADDTESPEITTAPRIQ